MDKIRRDKSNPTNHSNLIKPKFPIDNSTLAIILAAMFLSEKANGPTIFGVSLMAIGALVVAVAGTGKQGARIRKWPASFEEGHFELLEKRDEATRWKWPKSEYATHTL